MAHDALPERHLIRRILFATDFSESAREAQDQAVVWAGRWVRNLGLAGVLMLALLTPVTAQPEQRVHVTIKDFTFITDQMPLEPYVPVLITIRNEDLVRHGFGSRVFEGTMTQVESEGIITYGREIGGVYVDPGRGAVIRFTVERPGRFEFRCSIHADMKGELLVMSVGAV